MGQIKNALQKQIDSNARQKFFSTSGVIIDYDKLYNRATVRYLNPNGEGYVVRRNVPISSTLGGLSNGGVMPSQECTLSFVNGNMYSPIIIGITTSNYNAKESSDQGAFLIDESVRSVSKPKEISPMGKDWIDYDNQNITKYQNDLVDYQNLDIHNSSFDTLMNLSHFSDTEQGMTHLETHSNMKMKDNGDIEIFVADNVGIRISKAMKKIYLYGFDVNINGEINLLEILNKCRNCEFDGYHDKEAKEIKTLQEAINEYMDYIEGDIEELKRCVAYTKEITGDTDYFKSLDDMIERFESLRKHYNQGRYSDSSDNLNFVKNELVKLYEYFEQELVAARERWGIT